MEQVEMIKCSFCGWETPKWYVSKKYKMKSGYYPLRKHLSYCHPKEYEEINMCNENNEKAKHVISLFPWHDEEYFKKYHFQGRRRAVG